MPLISTFRRRLMMKSENKRIDPDVPGVPEIETDEDGNVVSYENTGTVEVTTADTCIDTQFVPFDGKDWELHINAHFQYSEQTAEYPTLLCCMQSASPWPGITVRYESSTTLYIICNDESSNKHYYTTTADSDGNVDIYIKYVSSAITVTNNSTTLASGISLPMDLEGLTLSLLCDVNSSTGEQRRFGIGTIYDFYVKKI